jgi:outer membrane protein assembly factor BamB
MRRIGSHSRNGVGRVRSRRLIVLVSSMLLVLVASGCDWTQFRYGSDHTGFNPVEITLSATNVANIREAWFGSTGGHVVSSPAVVNGVVYVGSEDGKLYAFPVACGTGGVACSPMWTGQTGQGIESSPAVVNGVVYVGSNDGNLYAFPAACGTGGAVCSPMWTGNTGNAIEASPVVANGVVYVSTFNGGLSAFPATCGTGGATCSPLWTASLGTGPFNLSSPAVSGGVVYVGSGQGTVFAFSTSCAANVSVVRGVHPDHTPPVCSPLWTANTSAEPSLTLSSPAISNGVVYIGANGNLWAFGATCATGGATCSPLWTAPIRDSASSPAVANGVVYVGDQAFSATGCGAPTCTPSWNGTTGGIDASSPASPSIANGVDYVGSQDGALYAFQVGCGTGGATCASLLAHQALTGADIESSPTIANGAIYVGSNDDELHAYNIPTPSGP